MQRSFTARVTELPRWQKRILAVAVDSFLCFATVSISYYLRLGFWSQPLGNQWLSYIASWIIAIPLFIRFGLYRAIFRYSGSSALLAIFTACAIYGLIYSSIFTLYGVFSVPRTVGLIQPVLLCLAIASSRAAVRYALGDPLVRRGNADPRRALVYGAGRAGRQMVAVLARSEEMRVIGFVDDDRSLWGSSIDGLKIYPTRDLPLLLQQLRIETILLSIPSASRKRRMQLLEAIEETGTKVQIVPSLDDLAHGRITVNDLRPLEIEDLLGRDTVAPVDNLLAKTIRDRTVLVTGAGGSIGSELCRQILRQHPETLLLLDNSELALYSVHQELLATAAQLGRLPTTLVPILGDVTDPLRIEQIFRQWKPATVYHAAAYKHVPLVEANAAQGVANNLFGTLNTAEAAMRHDCERFVLISTDKAVRPTNIMGATKRGAEMVLQALAAESAKSCFCMVRFGNVLGSSGSVVPAFRRQIAQGGPVTVTHAEMTRYFMTIPEAAELVIQAGAMADGGDVFLLDMGAPVKIIDLARQMIRLSGFSVRDADHPEGDIDIVVTGIRPGEKLYEELLIGSQPVATAHRRIMKGEEHFIPLAELRPLLRQMRDVVHAEGDHALVAEALAAIVKEYAASSEG